MPPPTPPKKNPRNTSAVTIVVAIIAAIALAGALWFVMNRRSHANEYNRIVNDLISHQKHEEAIAPLQKLIDRDPPDDIRRNAKAELAKAYIKMGDKDELSMKQRAEWFRKAQAVDASQLSEQQRTEIRLAGELPME